MWWFLFIKLKPLSPTSCYIGKNLTSFWKNESWFVRRLKFQPHFQNFVEDRGKRNFDYEGEDEPITDAVVNFKVNVLKMILDQTTLLIRERFETVNNHCNIFAFVMDLSSTSYMTDDELKNKYNVVGETFSIPGNSDVDAGRLFDEIRWICRSERNISSRNTTL